jgi:hypothetical protein
MIHSRRRLRACGPRDLLPELVTVRCLDCGWSVCLPMDEVEALVEAHPDGTRGLCECS